MPFSLSRDQNSLSRDQHSSTRDQHSVLVPRAPHRAASWLSRTGLVLSIAAALALGVAGAVSASDLVATIAQSSSASALDPAAGGEDLFSLPEGLAADLSILQMGATVVIDGFPVGNGERASVVLERAGVWSSRARITIIDSGVEYGRAVPTTQFYRGANTSGAEVRLAFELDRGRIAGNLHRADGSFQIMDQAAGSASHQAVRRMLPSEEPLTDRCGSEALLDRPSELEAAATDMRLAELGVHLNASTLSEPVALERAAGAPLRQAIVAVDTDSSFMAEKFGDDTELAVHWIENLFNEMNVIYERDLGLRLLIGETILRVGSDPYVNSDSWATSAALTEFSRYWSDTMDSVNRTFALMLSGNAGSPTSASGMAPISAYCQEYRGYALVQVFTADVAIINDARLVAHELGHNAGSPHTHCYGNPVDQCYGSEGGSCYAGAASCPANGRGTVMSYCSSGACGTSNLMEFHPRVAENIMGQMDANPSCFLPLADDAPLFTEDFEAGGLGRWTVNG